MEKEIAKKIMERVIEATAPLNDIVEIINDVDDLNERKSCRRHLVNVIASICDELIEPIVQEYPELSSDSIFWRTIREEQ